jgi:hypothetical protein
MFGKKTPTVVLTEMELAIDCSKVGISLFNDALVNLRHSEKYAKISIENTKSKIDLLTKDIEELNVLNIQNNNVIQNLEKLMGYEQS